MMSVAGELSSEIILDSGADKSALPLSYGDVGKSCNDVGLQDYIDAQGGKLDIHEDTSCVDLGNGVILRDACVYLLSGINFALIDSDCVPVTLYEIQELWCSCGVSTTQARRLCLPIHQLARLRLRTREHDRLILEKATQQPGPPAKYGSINSR